MPAYMITDVSVYMSRLTDKYVQNICKHPISHLLIFEIHFQYKNNTGAWLPQHDFRKYTVHTVKSIMTSQTDSTITLYDLKLSLKKRIKMMFLMLCYTTTAEQTVTERWWMSKIQSFIFKHSIFIGTIKTWVMNVDVQQGSVSGQKKIFQQAWICSKRKRMKKRQHFCIHRRQWWIRLKC